MSDIKLYRHPVTNRVKRSSNEIYMARAGFELWDGEVEVDKAGVQTADLTKADLQDLARQAGVSTSGSKADIQARLAEHASTQTTDTEPGDGSDPSSDSAGGDQ